MFIAIGSNVGEREKNLFTAIEMLSEKCAVLQKSKIYETEPVGFRDQPLFLNQCIECTTNLAPSDLLSFLKSIEQRIGRTKTFRNGPREIDLDIIFYGEKIMELQGLAIPHPRMQSRAFVLAPLSELAPDFVHPVLKKTISQLLAALPSADKSSVLAMW